MLISVVGLGLIGGSLARAIAEKTEHTVAGFDTDPAVLEAALAAGAVHRAGDESALRASGLVIVALYPDAAIAFIKEHRKVFAPGAVVVDTCGIKQKVCTAAADIACAEGFCFIGAHPMAGRERGGFENSTASLFDGASMILATRDDTPQTQMLEELSLQIGFGRITRTTPEEHDRIIAYTSQLPHVLACAYISDPDALLHHGFSAGSYKDVSRVATINAALWSELFIENRQPLTKHINLLISNLAQLRDAIQDEDADRLFDLLDNGDKIKRRIG